MVKVATWILAGIVVLIVTIFVPSCGMDNNAAAKYFKANQPTLSFAEASKDNSQEIANKLVSKWLDNFKSSAAPSSAKLEDYKINEILVRDELSDYPEYKGKLIIHAGFSVKPTWWSHDNWFFGGVGGVDPNSAWISVGDYFAIVKENNFYKLQEIGPAL